MPVMGMDTVGGSARTLDSRVHQSGREDVVRLVRFTSAPMTVAIADALATGMNEGVVHPTALMSDLAIVFLRISADPPATS